MSATRTGVKYQRVLLKLSGEALLGKQAFGLDKTVLESIADEILALTQEKVQLGLVVGGGNIFRGASLATEGMDRVTADYLGMLATVMNAVALREVIAAKGMAVNVMSAITVEHVCEKYDRRKALQLLDQGCVVIFAAGTGNPFFTTDTAASLRGIEMNVQIVLKATKVDGVYSADPMTEKSAKRYERLTYDQVIADKLKMMDTTAISLCRDFNMPICVFKMSKPGALMRVLHGENEGTLIEQGEPASD